MLTSQSTSRRHCLFALSDTAMLYEQIELARKAILQLKRSPAKYILPEYAELQRAQHEFDLAKKRLQRAQEVWNRLGEAP